MRETLLGKLVLVLFRATPEELAAIFGFARRLHSARPQEGALASRPEQVPTEEASKPGAQAGSAYVFRWMGRDWKVLFGGGEPFYLNDTVGARFTDYLLHHPNDLIAAFDLEVVVQAEKGAARARNSIQADSDDEPCASTGRS